MIPTTLAAAIVTLGALAPAGDALDDATRQTGREVAARAIEYLRDAQDQPTGAWAHNLDGPNLPAITGLVVNAMLKDPRIDARDAHVSRAIEYMLSMQQPDGGIYDVILPNYNTSICLSALAAAQTPEATSAMARGRSFLLGLQYHEGGEWDAEAPDFNEPVGRDHPYYGGVGYGKHGRPDLSNLSFFLQAMHDTGVAADDPAIKRALVFLSRTQMLDATNDMPYADGSSQGGFIYATVPNRESIDGLVGQSQAGEFEETLDDGTRVSRLRAYGSMTYAGFKSLIFADLDRTDPRVVAAHRWISEHYTLDENPGLGDDGLYYYYLTMARAMSAWGGDASVQMDRYDVRFPAEPGVSALRDEAYTVQLATAVADSGERFVLDRPFFEFEITPVSTAESGVSVGGVAQRVIGTYEGTLTDGRRYRIDRPEMRSSTDAQASGAEVSKSNITLDARAVLYVERDHDWRADIINTLASLQHEDGSFTVRSSRWMEDNEILITAYALLALQEALGR